MWSVHTISISRGHCEAQFLYLNCAQFRENFPHRDQDLFTYLEPTEAQTVLTNRRRKDQEKRSGLAAETFLEKLSLHIASAKVLSS